jgi:hypothetical protein
MLIEALGQDLLKGIDPIVAKVEPTEEEVKIKL